MKRLFLLLLLLTVKMEAHIDIEYVNGKFVWVLVQNLTLPTKCKLHPIIIIGFHLENVEHFEVSNFHLEKFETKIKTHRPP